MPSRCSWKAQPASCTLNHKLIIAYDGSRYWGWQKADPHPTIEGALEAALFRLLKRPIQLQAASRTDRGVHAEGQVVNLFSDEFDPRELVLPSDIVLREMTVVDPDFHPTLDAKAKLYTYDVCLGHLQLPFHRARSGHYRYPVSLERMRLATSHLLGRHDFSAFSGESTAKPICNLQSITVEELPDQRLRLTFFGDRFLFRMVRILTGTLLNVGSGMIAPADIPTILKSRDRSRAGLTAPAKGLTLNRVFY